MTGEQPRKHDEQPITRAIEFGANDPHGFGVGESVCNMLNLDPRLTLGELRAMVGERSWEATHEERMIPLQAEAFLAVEDLRRTDPGSPFITGRPRP